MKKTSSKIRGEIARLQHQLRQAETRDAERIGRIALKAGLGEIEIKEAALQAAFEEIAGRFRGGKDRLRASNSVVGKPEGASLATLATSAVTGSGDEA